MSQVATHGTTGNKRVYYNCILNSASRHVINYYFGIQTLYNLVARESGRFLFLFFIFYPYICNSLYIGATRAGILLLSLPNYIRDT